MAKIFKISGYLIDPDGDHKAEHMEFGIGGYHDMISQHVHVEEADIGKWDDESPLNYDNCDLAECEKYFKNKYPKEKKDEIQKETDSY